MKLLVLCVMLTVFGGVAALLYPLGQYFDTKARRLRCWFPPANNFLAEELRQPFMQRFLRPFAAKLAHSFSRFNAFGKKDNKTTEKLARQLKTAGIQLQAAEYMLIKGAFQLLVTAICIVAAIQFPVTPQMRLLIAAIGLLIAVTAPSCILKSKISARQNAIRGALPDVMDLLVVSVEAGLGFDSAILRLYEKNKSALMQELVASVKDVQMGLSRRSALKQMGERNDVQELKVFASAMIQAEQLGVSIKSVLVSQADQLRLARKQKTEAKAMKAPVKMMIPTVVFIFPVMFIILLGPAVLNFMNTF